MISSVIEENKAHFKRIADNINGTFSYQVNPSSSFRHQTFQKTIISLPYNDYNINYLADTSNPAFNVFSGVFIPFINKYDFQCKIWEKSFLDKFSLLKKTSKVNSGNGMFDKKMMFTANEHTFAIKMVKSEKVRKILMEQIKGPFSFEIRSDSFFQKDFATPEKISDMCIWCQDWIYQEEKIRDLFKAMKILADELKHARII